MVGGGSNSSSRSSRSKSSGRKKYDGRRGNAQKRVAVGKATPKPKIAHEKEKPAGRNNSVTIDNKNRIKNFFVLCGRR